MYNSFCSEDRSLDWTINPYWKGYRSNINVIRYARTMRFVRCVFIDNRSIPAFSSSITFFFFFFSPPSKHARVRSDENGSVSRGRVSCCSWLSIAISSRIMFPGINGTFQQKQSSVNKKKGEHERGYQGFYSLKSLTRTRIIWVKKIDAIFCFDVTNDPRCTSAFTFLSSINVSSLTLWAKGFLDANC